ncbi:DNA polymerase III subunit delta' [Porphyrobacter sp. GA68]|uniref:DNA polymerase III subunit delta' n=1 Tax=Porphyrobacter sp. GA68 TaxID=2883480 RepID=UPI001D183D49|nr:DNA polymerase III subunit delta' [Porphyrobacter sp. GA68]
MSSNAAAQEAWAAALTGGRMHHAWLLAGPAGSGARKFAFAAAAELVGSEDAAGYHPDIEHLKREPKDASEARKQEEGKPFDLARSISVAQIRRLQQRLTTRPSAGTRRAIIVDTIDDLETAAANAMLKSLEEPPGGTVFLLICHNPGRLLATIRSRCRVLRFLAQDAPSGDEAGPQTVRDAARAAVESMVAGEPASGNDSAETLMAAMGARPRREELHAVIALARTRLIDHLPAAGSKEMPALDGIYQELGLLERELATYNYDPDLAAARIAALLASLRGPIAARNG